MRNTFADTMTELAKDNENLCLLSGDIGNRMFDGFKAIAPKRFLNCGIAEANMMSVASGMALSGLRPVVYTITPFTTTRCLEQIKIGAAYHKAPIVIVGTGSGLSYAELGPTHHSFEDIAITRCIPNLNVCAPCDAIELDIQLREAIQAELPTYIRIGKKESRILTKDPSSVGIGRSNIIRKGRDMIIIGIGPLLANAIDAAEELEDIGISVAVGSLGSAKPLDQEFLNSISSLYKTWIVLEEHSVNGGIGGALLEWLAETNKQGIKVIRKGIPDNFIHKLGDQQFAREQLKLDAQGIKETIAQEHNTNKDI